jgi:hypothetical protein
MPQTDGLDIDRPERFLARERRAQRIGAGVLVLFIIAGASGLFGGGPVSHATARSGAIEVGYERFGRLTHHTATRIRVTTTAADGQPVTVYVDRDFLEHVSLLEIRPAGAQKALDADSAIFEVPAAQGAAHLELHYEPQRFGSLQIQIGTGPERVAVRQLVFF